MLSADSTRKPVYAVLGIVFLVTLAFSLSIPLNTHDIQLNRAQSFLTPLPSPSDPLSPYGVMSAYLAQQLQESGNPDLQLDYSPGSFDSLLKLEDSYMSFALVQADVLYHYLHGDHPQFPEGKSDSRIRAVARAFPEFLYMTTPAASKPVHDAYLVIPNADAGPQGSGSLVTSLNVARFLHTRWYWRLHSESRASAIDPPRPRTWLFDIFHIIQLWAEHGPGPLRLRVQSPPFTDTSGWRLVWMDPPSARVLENSLENIYTQIPASEAVSNYQSRLTPSNTPMSTIAVDAILVCTSDVNGDTIDAVIKALHHFAKDCRQAQPQKATCCQKISIERIASIVHTL